MDEFTYLYEYIVLRLTRLSVRFAYTYARTWNDQ